MTKDKVDKEKRKMIKPVKIKKFLKINWVNGMEDAKVRIKKYVQNIQWKLRKGVKNQMMMVLSEKICQR